MHLLKTYSVSFAVYKDFMEPERAPVAATEDIVRVLVRPGETGKYVTYEFHKNPPEWGSMVPGYKWQPYRRASGPLGWLTAE